MKNKSLIIIIAVLVAVIAVAAVAYPSLSKKAEENMKSDTTSQSEDKDSEKTSLSPDSEEYKQFEGIKFYDKDGKEVVLTDMLGKPIIINFWATWCGYCIMEMPDFEAAYKKYGDEVQFVFINPDEDIKTGESFIKGKGFDIPTYYDLDTLAAYAFSIRSYPTTAAIDAKGNIKYLRPGMITAETLEGIIKSIK